MTKGAKVWVVRPTDPKTVGEILVRARESLSAIDDGRVFIGKKRVRTANEAVKAGDEIRIGNPTGAPDVPILYQAKDLVAVAKPAGMPTVPDHQGASHSLVGVVARMFGKKPGDVRITSRLDRNVSGAVVFAFSERAEQRLKEARARGAYARRYVALGKLDPDKPVNLDYMDRVINVDRVSADQDRHRDRDQDREVDRDRRSRRVGEWRSEIDGKAAETRYRVVSERRGAAVMLAVDPVTGRTHQIRIHASRAGVPLLGDPTYGGPSRMVLADGRVVSFERIALHAARVAVAGVVAQAPIPPELARMWTELGGEAEAWNTALSCDTSLSSD